MRAIERLRVDNDAFSIVKADEIAVKWWELQADRYAFMPPSPLDARPRASPVRLRIPGASDIIRRGSK